MFTGVDFERDNGRGGRLMLHDEKVVVTEAETWLPDTQEAWRRYGVSAPLQALIETGGQEFQAFRTLDGLPGTLRMDPRLKGAAFLLTGGLAYADRRSGVMAIRADDDWTTIGRLESHGLELADTISARHFRVRCDASNLYLHNLWPTNKTWLYRNLAVPALSTTFTGSRALVEAQVQPGFEYGLVELPVRGEDRSLVMPGLDVYGVFDGAGGTADGAGAAQAAADTVRRVFNSAPPESGAPRHAEELRMEVKYALQTASNIVTRDFPGSASTGLVVRIVRDAISDGYRGPHVVWAAAGDSLGYVLQYPELCSLNMSEGTAGSVLMNSLGFNRAVRQSGVLPVMSGDKVLLLTDGITGNDAADVLRNQEIIAACEGYDPQRAAKNLLRISRKFGDDKTGIVIEI